MFVFEAERKHSSFLSAYFFAGGHAESRNE